MGALCVMALPVLFLVGLGLRWDISRASKNPAVRAAAKHAANKWLK